MRDSGFFWVRLYSWGPYVPAEHVNGCWVLTGNENVFVESDFIDIGEKINHESHKSGEQHEKFVEFVPLVSFVISLCVSVVSFIISWLRAKL